MLTGQAASRLAVTLRRGVGGWTRWAAGLWAIAIALVVVYSVGVGTVVAGEGPVALPPGDVEEFTVAFLGDHLAAAPDASIWGTIGVEGKIDRMSGNGLLTGEYSIPVGAESDEPIGSYPTDIALGTDGLMWFLDDGHNTEEDPLIGRVTPTGSIREFPVLGGYGFLDGLSVGPDGHMWFTGRRFGTGGHAEEPFVGRINEQGEIALFPIPMGESRQLPATSAPGAIATGADGNLWFTDEGTNDEGHELIGRVTPSGAITEYPIPRGGFVPLGAMALGSDGAIWFDAETAIDRVSPDGRVVEYGLPPEPQGSPWGLIVGVDGNLWFGDGVDRIGRITTSGIVTIFSQAAAGEPIVTAIVSGAEGDLWYPARPGHFARLAIPFSPAAVSAPAISGSPTVGASLTITDGTWEHGPANFAYQWELCDAGGGSCEVLAGATGQSIALSGSDVNRTLRASVTASNVGGSASATSAPSPTIGPAPELRPAVPPIEVVPEIGTAMTWTFGWARRYTVIESMILTDVPATSEVEVRCTGKGCPFTKRRYSPAATTAQRGPCRTRKCKWSRARKDALDLTQVWRRRRLQVGARVTVLIVKPRWIGKVFKLSVRADRRPKVKIVCVGVDSRTTAVAC